MRGVSVPPELFDEDYLYFYADVLGDDRSDADARVVARLLSLQPGMRVLDIPCGEGRIAGRLARLGCEVVGLDASERLLALAGARYPEVRFERRDMRELAYRSEFDAVVNWFTSFGYFDSATNDALLASLARALRRGGRLLLDIHNPARLARILELTGGSTASVAERDGNLMVDRITYNAADQRSRTERSSSATGACAGSSSRSSRFPPSSSSGDWSPQDSAKYSYLVATGVRLTPTGRA